MEASLQLTVAFVGQGLGFRVSGLGFRVADIHVFQVLDIRCPFLSDLSEVWGRAPFYSAATGAQLTMMREATP